MYDLYANVQELSEAVVREFDKIYDSSTSQEELEPVLAFQAQIEDPDDPLIINYSQVLWFFQSIRSLDKL